MKRIGIFAVLLLALSCLNDKNQPNPVSSGADTNAGTVLNPSTPSNVTCSPDTVYFQQTILPLITSNCAMSGCHDAISHKEGVILTDYAHIRAYSSTTNPAGSSLYRSVVTGYMPNKTFVILAKAVTTKNRNRIFADLARPVSIKKWHRTFVASVRNVTTSKRRRISVVLAKNATTKRLRNKLVFSVKHSARNFEP